jgi:thiamine phosphate synthase YjbQ (UPF0047 family)
MLNSHKKSFILFFQIWHSKGVNLQTSVHTLKGEEDAARSPYHIHRIDFGRGSRLFYCEFDGQRPKRVIVKVIGE